MKKLMVVIALALATASIHAASVDWKVTCGNMMDHTGAAFSGKYELFASGGDLSSDLLVLSIASQGATLNQYAFTVDSGLTAGEDYNFYYKITDSGNYSFTSSTVGPFSAVAVGAPVIQFGNQATATSTGTWTAAPEPTSGLMLLIGVGLMAIKRKRA